MKRSTHYDEERLKESQYMRDLYHAEIDNLIKKEKHNSKRTPSGWFREKDNMIRSLPVGYKYPRKCSVKKTNHFEVLVVLVILIVLFVYSFNQ